jgi:Holliday junction DNA helicase RuvA
MIALVRGTLLEKGPESVLIEAGGIGYEVFVPAPALASLPAPGEEIRLYTHFHVREDAQILFGFLTPSDRQVFLLLMTVKGVGPKVALGILSKLPAQDLATALQRRDLAALTRLPGVGKKLAERLVLELKDKLDDFASAPAGVPVVRGGAVEDVLSALTNLGYQRVAAEKAVQHATEKEPGVGEDFDGLFRAALKVIR